MDSPDGQALRFQTTAKASADAHALAHVGLARFDLIVDGVALVLALVLVATGNLFLAVIVIAFAALSLAGNRFHLVQRALIAIRFRSILGQTTEVMVEDEGLRFVNPLASSFVPWTSINAVRSNSQTVAFFRDHVLLGYIPSIAFESPAARSKVVAFAQSRIAALNHQPPGR